MLADSILIALAKGNGSPGVRPIALGDFCLKVAWRLQMQRTTNPFHGTRQMAFQKDGVLRTLIILQQALDNGHVITKMDMKNAFNEAQRSAIKRALHDDRHLSHLYSLYDMIYGRPTSLFCFDERGNLKAEIPSAEGVRQGCVSGSYLFSLLLKDTLAKYGDSVVAYMDDIYIITPQSTHAATVEAVTADLAKLGLKVNPAKTLKFSSATLLSPVSTLGGYLFGKPPLSPIDTGLLSELNLVLHSSLSVQFKWLLTVHIGNKHRARSKLWNSTLHMRQTGEHMNALLTNHCYSLFHLPVTVFTTMQFFIDIASGGYGIPDFTHTDQSERFDRWLSVANPDQRARILAHTEASALLLVAHVPPSLPTLRYPGLILSHCGTSPL